MTTTLDEKEQAEIATFIDTGKTVVHRGRTFSILNVPPNETRADSKYVLRSARGQYYALIRNKPNPTALFGIALYSGRMSILPGWFTDKTGELVSVG